MVAKTNQELDRLQKLSRTAEELVRGGNRTPEQISHLLQELQRFKDLRENVDVEKLKLEWQRFYKEVFGYTTDFSKLQIPDKANGFNWLIIHARLKLSEIFKACKERFPIESCFTEMGKVDSNRSYPEIYAIWVRDRIEADRENKNRSARYFTTPCITFEERLLLEIWYYRMTGGEHLDTTNATLCTGSHYDHSGYVPTVCWRNKLIIGFCRYEAARNYIRTRSVITIPD